MVPKMACTAATLFHRSCHTAARLALIGFLTLLVSACSEEAPEAVEEVEVGIGEGLRAPQLTGRQPDGQDFQIDFDDDDPTVLVFYGSADCGLCRLQLDQIQQNLDGYDRDDAQVVAVTLDTPARSGQLVSDAGLAFPVVSVDSATFREWEAIPDSGRTALPATYVIDRAGIIRFRHVGRNAADRTTDADILTIVHRLASL